MLYADFISFSVKRKCQKIPKFVKAVNVEEENLHIFLPTGEIQ